MLQKNFKNCNTCILISLADTNCQPRDGVFSPISKGLILETTVP